MNEHKDYIPEAESEVEKPNLSKDKVNQSRRQFLKGVVLGAAGLAVSKFIPESLA